MVMEEQTSSGRLLISQMGHSTIVVIPAVVTLLATMMSVIVLTVERVRLTSDDVMPLFVIVPAAICWPVLYLFEIRRAWLVAVLGGVFMGVLWRLAAQVDIGNLYPAVPLGGIVAYPLAVLVAAPRVPVVWRVLPLALFAGLFWLGA
ncbi:hypothetical protein [Nonomuraea sp. NPDC046570]|uniref:hypothetical protein n=1 Tax=Nonomuraea sp. NPDC046570 TaxID=3155255 RepID=UPI0033E973AF